MSEPSSANAAVFVPVNVDLSTFTPVKGCTTLENDSFSWEQMFESFATTGFQATNLGYTIYNI